MPALPSVLRVTFPEREYWSSPRETSPSYDDEPPEESVRVIVSLELLLVSRRVVVIDVLRTRKSSATNRWADCCGITNVLLLEWVPS